MVQHLILPLGNPGRKYENTRHNVAWLFADYIVEKINDSNIAWKTDTKTHSSILKWNSIIFAKPQTFMNKSGQAASSLLRFYNAGNDNVLVIHDDLDIPFGSFKLSPNKGPKIHNGISSVEQALGTKEFKRLRIGIENRHQDTKISGHDYVLQMFPPQEHSQLPTVFDRIITHLEQQLFTDFKLL